MHQNSLSNLKPWTKGISGNPAGRKPGSRNISTIVQEILEQDIDDDFPINERLNKLLSGKQKSYVEAVAIAMTKKAIDGDVRAATWLVEQQQKGEAKQQGGLFNTDKLTVEVISPKSPSTLD